MNKQGFVAVALVFFLSFSCLSQLGFVHASSTYTVELWVNGFDSTQMDWTEAGSSPYLDTTGSGTGNITSTVRYNQEKFFGYTNFTSTYTTIDSVAVCVYANTAGNDGIILYLTNSTGEASLGTQYFTASFAWYNFSATPNLPTNTEINNAKTNMYSARNGAVMSAVIIDASLIRVTYTVVSASSFSLSQTVSATSSLQTQKALTKPLSATATATSSLDSNKALTKLLSETVAITSALDYAIDIGAQFLEFALSGTANITSSLATQKAIGKTLSATTTITEALVSQKALTKLLSATATVTSALASSKALTKLFSATATITDSLISLKALTKLFSSTVTIISSLDTVINIGAKFLEFVLSGNVTATSQLTTQKALTKLLSQTITATDSTTFQKAITGIFSETLAVITSFESTAGIHALFIEYLNTIRITDLLRSPFPPELMSIDEAVAMAVVACMISGVVVGTMFMFRRKRNDEY